MKAATKGECLFCSKKFSKGGFTRHLKTCKSQNMFFENHYKKIKRRKNTYYLAIYAKYDPEFWIHIIIDGKKTLETLDDFLRDIWLECCGHLSEFEIDGIRYTVSTDEEFDMDEEYYLTEDESEDIDDSIDELLDGISSQTSEKLDNFISEFLENNKEKFDQKPDINTIQEMIEQTLNSLPDKEFEELEKLADGLHQEIVLHSNEVKDQNQVDPFLENIFKNMINETNPESMDVRIQDVLSENSKISYVYDFGSSTELVLKVIKIDQLNYNYRSLLLLARNELPTYPCSSCNNTAKSICEDCMFDGISLFCDSCSKQHKHESDEENLIKLDVNSPRLGVCGYS